MAKRIFGFVWAAALIVYDEILAAVLVCGNAVLAKEDQPF